MRLQDVTTQPETALVCRACERPFNATFEQLLRQVRLTPYELRTVSALARRPRTLRELIEAVYAHDPDGGPDTADMCVKVYVTKARQKLRAHGYRIRMVFADEHRYHLIGPSEPQPQPQPQTAGMLAGLVA